MKSSVLRWVHRFHHEKWLGYGFGLLAFVLALGGRFALDPCLPHGFPFLTFFPAIVLSTLVAGRGPGTACAVISLLAARYWFIEPRFDFHLNFESGVAVGFFAFVAIVDVLVIDMMTRALACRDLLQKQTDALVVQRTTFFQELQHRVANNLMIVATSLALQEKRLKHNREAVEALESVRRRFEALSNVHRRLHDPANGCVPFGPYVQALCDDFLNASEDKSIRCDVEVSDTCFDADRTVTLSLIVLEAVANAAKHAFAPDQSGSVVVRLTAPQSGHSDHVLTIEDNGRGIRPDFDVHQSERLGMGILKGFARSLRGQLFITAASETGGTIVRVNFPVLAN